MAVLLSAALLASCDQFEDHGVRDLTAPLPSARIKFHNFSPGLTGVDFYANDTKMSGVLTSSCGAPATAADSTACATTGKVSTTGITFGGAAAGGRYAGIDAGQYTLTAKLAATDVVVSTVSQPIAAGKYYSYFTSGVYNTGTKTAEAFVVEDAMPTGAVDYSVAKVRFVNAVSNGTGPMTLFATNVAYKGASAFVDVPSGTYSLATRYNGSTTNVITRTSVAFIGGHTYTIASRGSTATASTLGLDYTENQP